MKYIYFYKFPTGRAGIAEDSGSVTGVYITPEISTAGYTLKETPLISETAAQIWEYFRAERKTFTLPIALKGTAFQVKVWSALSEIPYGETRTYKDIAKQIGNEKACRAVGSANHNNPISIIVPCHRVVGINGLVGYGGGIEMKRYLLDLEATNK